MLTECVYEIERTNQRDWRIVLNESLTVADACGLHAALIEVLGEEGDVAIDCANLNSIDASILQLLIALHVGLTKQERVLCLLNCSPELTARFQQVGLPGDIAVQ